jgi:hypothetical protein
LGVLGTSRRAPARAELVATAFGWPAQTGAKPRVVFCAGIETDGAAKMEVAPWPREAPEEAKHR